VLHDQRAEDVLRCEVSLPAAGILADPGVQEIAVDEGEDFRIYVEDLTYSAKSVTILADDPRQPLVARFKT
jgi:hypothetical protein